MPRGSQTCVTNKPAQNDGLVRLGRAVAEQVGEQQRVASGYARLPRTAATERVESASDSNEAARGSPGESGAGLPSRAR